MLIRRIIIFLTAFLGLAASLYAGDVQIRLKPGLNYISISNGTKRSVEEVLSALPQSSRKSAYYDTALKKYLFFVPDTDYREFSEFEFLRGYWVKNDTAGDVTLTISGTTPNAYSIVLKAGWNAIGCPGDKEISVEEALLPLKLGEDYSSVLRYASNEAPWYQECSKDKFIPGEGYWIKMLKQKTWDFSVDTTPPDIKITSPTDNVVTNQTKITLQGTIDGVSFQEDRDLPNEGNNTITKTAIDKAGNNASKSITVIRDTTPPNIIITSPSEGFTTNQQTITVSYTVDGAAKSESRTLQPGLNTITITDKDVAGNIASASINGTLDTVAPVITIVSPADNTTTSQSNITVTYKVDGGANKTKDFTLINGLNTLTIEDTDAAGNKGSATLKITLNTAAPTGTIKINNDDAYTNKTIVSLTLSATDTNGIDKMQFSNDGITFTTAETYATTKSWTLASGDGLKTVYVKYQNKLGIWSVAISDTITLNTSLPDQPVVVDDGATTEVLNQLHVKWTAQNTDNIVEYQYAIGTTQGAVDIVDWTSAALNTEITKTGLNLTAGQMYYFAVRAKNSAGTWGPTGISDGIKAIINHPPVINNLVPGDASTYTQGDKVSFTVDASDPDGDSLEYQFLIDGAIKQPWTSISNYVWDTATETTGIHIVKVQVWDKRLTTEKSIELYGYRSSITPPDVTAEAQSLSANTDESTAQDSVPENSEETVSAISNSTVISPTPPAEDSIPPVKILDTPVSIPVSETKVNSVLSRQETPKISPVMVSQAQVTNALSNMPTKSVTIKSKQSGVIVSQTLNFDSQNKYTANSYQQKDEAADKVSPVLILTDKKTIFTNVVRCRIGGVKETDESVWINGEKTATADGKNNWSSEVKLDNGRNPMEVVTKDAYATSRKTIKAEVYLDTTPPEGEIDNIQAVGLGLLRLELSAFDKESGMQDGKVQFSFDGNNWFSPLKYLPIQYLRLTDTKHGSLQTIYARFQDAAGNWSKPASKTFMFTLNKYKS